MYAIHATCSRSCSYYVYMHMLCHVFEKLLLLVPRFSKLVKFEPSYGHVTRANHKKWKNRVTKVITYLILDQFQQIGIIKFHGV
jgi:hypothetical protein